MKIKDTSDQDIKITPKTNTTKKWLSISPAVVIVGAIIWQVAPSASNWSKADKSISQDRIRVATVTRGDLTRDISTQGRVVAAVSPTVYTPAEGTITLMIEAGNEVKKGQVLATLESPELTNELSQEKAILSSLESKYQRQVIQAKRQHLEDQKSVDLANVKLTTAKREKRRAEQGYSKNAISQIDFEKARDDLENASLQHKHAVQDAKLNTESQDFEGKTLLLEMERQQLKVAELQRQVDGLSISSPVNGIVGNLNVVNKTLLAKNQAILTVVDLSQFEVEIAIPESYADDLAIGMDVEISALQQDYRARLVTISPEIQNNQVTGRVRFQSTPPTNLRQNQRLTTRILLEQKQDVIQVTRGQFLESGGGRFAYKISDGLAQKTPIQVGARSLAKVEILSGLNPGDQIIISGTDIFQAAEQVLISQ